MQSSTSCGEEGRIGEQSEGPPGLGGPVAVSLRLEGGFERSRPPSGSGQRAQIALRLISHSFNGSHSHSLSKPLIALCLPGHCLSGRNTGTIGT